MSQYKPPICSLKNNVKLMQVKRGSIPTLRLSVAYEECSHLKYIGLVDTFRKGCRTWVRTPPDPPRKNTLWVCLVLTAFEYGKRRGLSPIKWQQRFLCKLRSSCSKEGYVCSCLTADWNIIGHPQGWDHPEGSPTIFPIKMVFLRLKIKIRGHVVKFYG